MLEGGDRFIQGMINRVGGADEYRHACRYSRGQGKMKNLPVVCPDCYDTSNY